MMTTPFFLFRIDEIVEREMKMDVITSRFQTQPALIVTAQLNEQLSTKVEKKIKI